MADNGWEDVEIHDPREIIPAIFPGARVTSTSRSRNDPLSRKNPNSKHIDNPQAFDMAPVKGMDFNTFLTQMREKGYEIEQPIDEVKNPSRHATGPHWHGVIKSGPKNGGWEDVTQNESPSPVPTLPEAPVAGPRGIEDRVSDSYAQEANRGFTGWVAREVMALTGINTPEEFDKLPYDQRRAALNQAATQINEKFDKISKADPKTAQDLIAGLVGGTLGGADPTMAIMAGKNIIQRILAAGAIGGASNVAEQGFDMGAGIRKEFSPTELGLQAAGGVALQGGLEGVGKGISKMIGGRQVTDVNGDGILSGSDLQEPRAPLPGEDEGLTGSVTYDPPVDYGVRTPEEQGHFAQAVLEEADALGIPPERIPNALKERDFIADVKQNLAKKGLPQDIAEKGDAPAPANDGELSNAVPRDVNSVSTTADAGTPVNDNVAPDEFGNTDGLWDRPDVLHGQDAQDYVSSRPKFVLPSNDNPLGGMAAEIPASPTPTGPSGPRTIANDVGLREESVSAEVPRPGADGPQPPSGGEPPDTPSNGRTDPVIDRLKAYLSRASRLTNEQKALYSKERRDRLRTMKGVREGTSGREGFYAEKSALQGEMPKVEFEPIEDQFTPDEINGLFDNIKDSDQLSWYGQITARSGLERLLTGQLARPSEINALSKVFDPEFVKLAMRHRSGMQKIYDHFTNAINLPRSIMASFDLSGMGRQGIFMISRPEYWKSFAKQFKALGKEGFQGVMDNIKALPHYDKMEEAGLALTDAGYDLNAHEEDFMSRWASKIPGVSHSERAYVGGLNNLRANSFNKIMSKWDALGHSYTPDDVKALAKYINNATGRGDMGRWAAAGPALNTLFFSPRLIASRVNLLNPVYYAKLPPLVRKEAVRDLIAFGTIATTVLELAHLAGAEVETDPRSADFGKIKDGNTRYDILGGFQPYIRLASQIVTNEKKTLKGKIQPLDGKGNNTTAFHQFADFVRNKTAPVVSYGITAQAGQNPVGEPYDPVTTTGSLFVPLFLQDLYEGYKDAGFEGAVKALPSGLGISAQTFDVNKPRGEKNSAPAVIEEVGGPPPKEEEGWVNVQ